MWITSVRFPKTETTTQDSAGFVEDVIEYTSAVPASRRDATRNDETLAQSMGYTVSRIYTVDAMAYNGAGYLIDDIDGFIYDIKRTHQKDKSTKIELTCEVREHGKLGNDWEH